MTSFTPIISVVIPTLNEGRCIQRAVRSVASADQVIVVDGGSRDDTCQRARESGATVVSTPAGRGTQLSRGARQAAGNILLFLHADCWSGEDALAQLRQLAEARAGRRLFGAFRQQIDDRRFRFRLLEWGNAARVRWLRLPYGDQAVFIDRETYFESGQFAEVPLMEDVLLARAVRPRCRPRLLPGPVHVSSRRWRRRGVARCTLRNWLILSAFQLGASPEQLARWYR